MLGMSDVEVRTVRRAALVHCVRQARGVQRDPGQTHTVGRCRAGADPDGAVPDRAHAASVTRPRGVGRDRGAACRASRRVRIPEAACPAPRSRDRRGFSAAADAYQSMREPRAYREAMSPEAAASKLRDRGEGRTAGVRRGRGRPRRGRAPRAQTKDRTGRAHGPRDRRPAAARAGSHQQGDRRAARDLAARRWPTTSSTSTPRSMCRRARRPALFATQHGLLGDEEPVSV